MDKAAAKEAYFMAVESMSVLNKNAAHLMKRHGCHGATDVTGFGIRGHAKNLVEAQKEKVDFRFHSIPVIDRMHLINEHVFNFKLTEGYSAETSGGLLVMVPPQKVEAFQADLWNEFGQKSWVVGDVVASAEDSRQVWFGKDGDWKSIKVINVGESFMKDED